MNVFVNICTVNGLTKKHTCEKPYDALHFILIVKAITGAYESMSAGCHHNAKYRLSIYEK